MKKLIMLFAAGLFFNFVIAQNSEPQKLIDEFDEMLSTQFKKGEPGATAFVAKNGKIIYEGAFGMANLELDEPMQIDNVFRIGSITKQFTAVAILQLMEKGKLKLDDEITKFIPDYPMQGKKITIEHLLTHTSGIQSYTSMKDYMTRMTLDLSPTEMIDHFKNEPMQFDPGTAWEYSNSGYFLLGYIIEKISGKTYGEYLQENFFDPIGMTNSYYGSEITIIKNRVGAYSKSEYGIINAPPLSMTQPFAAGSIQSTVRDLFKWHQALHSYKVIKKESLEKAFTNYSLNNGTKTGYGYGWFLQYIQESPTIEHGGGINGTLTMSIYLPDEDVFVAVFSNCDCNEPEDIAAKMAAFAIGKSYTYKKLDFNNAQLKEYTGVFKNAKGEFREISLSDNQLFSQRGRNQKFNINAFEKDKFYFEGSLSTLEYKRNEKGEIDKLIMHNRTENEPWSKTNEPMPSGPVEIIVDEVILDTYVGEYEIEPGFTFVITKTDSKLFLQATDQEQVEIFAETESKFFLKVNDAQLEFVKDDSGIVTKSILTQGGRKTDAVKIK
ncbi:MAG: serine hydrolase [Chitinophagales bacterium]